MPPKKLLTFFVIFAIGFIAFGDSLTFLPKQARDASVSSRKFVIGLWPKWLRPRNTNEQRERQIDQLDKPTPSR